MEALGLTARDVYLVHDEITGQTWRWGQHAFVRLTADDPAHVLTLIRYGTRTPSRRSGLRSSMTGSGDPQVAEQVMAYITGARWFAGKGRLGSLVSLTPLPWLSEVTEFYSPVRPAGGAVGDRRGGVRGGGGARADDRRRRGRDRGHRGSDPRAVSARRLLPAGAAPRPAPRRDRPGRRSRSRSGHRVRRRAGPRRLPGPAEGADRAAPAVGSGRLGPLPYHRCPGPDRRPRTAGVHRPAVQHLGDAR